MRLALLFSGQGGQTPEHWRQVDHGVAGELRAALLRALPAIGEGQLPSPEMLARNRIAQPLIFAQQMMSWHRLRDRLPRPICAAGYSLGEMAACCAAGAFSASDGVALCAERAALMDAAAAGEHGMLAVLGLDEALVASLAAEAGLAVAIRNAPRHLVLAGPRSGIASITERLLAAGASRLVPLAVQTPSHTPLLAGAAVAFAERLAHMPDGRLAFPVLGAVDGTAARTVRPALAALGRQIATLLDWAACLQSVRELQPDAVLEIGPGNALTRLFVELAPEIPARACDDFRSDDGIVHWIESCAG
ncbi:malonate decarboxylase subunit epsilon [Azonexus hydrophilus]|uniref:Malonate decarboxylase subunit epsilon n=1 Tax=Azonexus hydrophilus TaxID=418702 RepID=A0A1R1I3A0_9RHOO|nr:malonate decarboxylase subunit epsilon [Azonexus hydrophilus]OMG53177.1 malonate decarboxylase subunit epsilon [Azonexus hydrophilus]